MEGCGRFCRALAILLAVLVTASSCGGDEEPAPDGDDEQAQDLGQGQQPDIQESEEVQEGTQPDDASPGTDPVEDGSLDSVEPEPSQADASEETGEPGNESAFAPVELGSRFPWCSEVQDHWNNTAAALAQTAAAETAYLDAKEAFEATTDELEAVEARVALESAEAALEESRSTFASGARGAVLLIIPGTPSLDDITTVNIETHAIAVGRAREAFRANADQATLELSELIHQVNWSVADLITQQEHRYSTPGDRWPPFVVGAPPSLSWEFYDKGELPDNAPDDFQATLAAIENIRIAAQEASTAAIPALEQMGRAVALVAAMSSREEVLTAAREWAEAMRRLSKVSAFSPLSLQDLVDSYKQRVWEDLNQLFPVVRISQEDHDAFVAAVDDAAAVVEFPDIADQLPAWVTTEFGEGPFSGFNPDDDYALGNYVLMAFRHGGALLPELRRVGESFMFADTAAVEAFWASISESCEA